MRVQAVVIIAVLTAGTAVIMRLGEQITISGIGNGISIILFAVIASRFPTLIKQLFQYLDTGLRVASLVPCGVRQIPFDDRLHRIYG